MTKHQVLVLVWAAVAVGADGSSGPSVALPFGDHRQLQSALCDDAMVACAGEMFPVDGLMACDTCSSVLGECIGDNTTSEWMHLCLPCGPQSEEDFFSSYEGGGICGDLTDITRDYILSCFGQPPDCPRGSGIASTTDTDDFSSSTDDYDYTTDSDDFYVTTDDDYYSPTTDDDSYYSPTTDDDDEIVYDDYYPTPSPVPEPTPAPPEDPTPGLPVVTPSPTAGTRGSITAGTPAPSPASIDGGTARQTNGAALSARIGCTTGLSLAASVVLGLTMA